MPAKTTKPRSAPKPSAGDWREAILAHVRSLILEAAPDVSEEQKWKKPSNPEGVALWSHNGMICTGEKYKDKVKLTFAYGASLPDPTGLFNVLGTGATRRAIDIKEGDQVNARAFKALVKAAAIRNTAIKKEVIRVKGDGQVTFTTRSRIHSAIPSTSN